MSIRERVDQAGLPPSSADGDEGSTDELLAVFAESVWAGGLNESTRRSWYGVDPSDAWTRRLQCIELLTRAWPAAGRSPPPSTEEPLLGRFVRQRELGQGATSVVFLAFDPTLKRLVALKVPRPGTLCTPELRRRFLREGPIAAGLRHRNIVAVYEVQESGPACFLVTEYCPGPNLADWLRRRETPLPPQMAARWLAELTDAVAHAHARGVLHRDIKPSNILLEPSGDAGVSTTGGFGYTVKLTDFGLAKVLQHNEGTQTRDGAILGTPAYMSPEQATGNVQDIRETSDVYSLGALLYELLTGRPPFQAESAPELLRQVVQDDPVSLRRLRPGTPRDLETICLKCLAKSPSRRYLTAAELADDLQRFLRGQTIRARRAGLWEKAASYIRRRPVVAMAWMICIVSILSLSAGFAFYRHQMFLVAQDEVRREQVDRHVQYCESLRGARRLLSSGAVHRGAEILDSLVASSAPLNVEFAGRHLWNDLVAAELVPLPGATPLFHPAWSSDGSQLAAVVDGRIRVWDARSGRIRFTSLPPPLPLTSLQFAPPRHWVAIDLKGEVSLWDARSGVCEKRYAVRMTHPTLAVSPNGRELLISDSSDTALRIELASGRHLDTFVRAGGIVATAWTPSGLPITAGEDGIVLRSPEKFHIGMRKPGVGPLTLSQTGLIAYVPYDSSVVHTRKLLGPDPGPCFTVGSPIREIEFVSGSDQLLVSDPTRTAVWDIHTGRPLRTCPIVADSIAVSPTQRVALVSGGGNAWIWKIDGPQVRTSELNLGDEAWTLAFHPDQPILATGSDNDIADVVCLWDMKTGRRIRSFPGHSATVSGVAFSSDGNQLLSCGLDGLLIAREVKTGREIFRKSTHVSRGLRSLAVSPDGRHVAAGGYDGSVRLWNARNGEELRVLPAHEKSVRALAFSPDGAVLLSGSEDGRVRVWDTRTWRESRAWTEPGEVWAGAVSPDGKTAAVGVSDGRITLRSLASETELLTLVGHAAGVQSLAFSRDGRTLASGSADRTVHLWDPTVGRELNVLAHGDQVRATVFSPDGHLLASASHDGIVKLWDGSQPRPLITATRSPVMPGSDRPIARPHTPRTTPAPRIGAVPLLDPSFGTNGVATARFQYPATAPFLAVDPQSRIVVSGTLSNPNGASIFGIARFTQAGALDPTFGKAGLVADSIRDWNEQGVCAIDRDSRILLSGTVRSRRRDDFDFALMRYRPDGLTDESFGFRGKALMDITRLNDRVFAMSQDQDGRTLLAGGSAGSVALARFLRDGRLDESFGSKGVDLIGSKVKPAVASAVCLDPEGRICFAGTGTTEDQGLDFLIGRCLPNGDDDLRFGMSGLATMDFGKTDDEARAMTIDAQGRIVVAGTSSSEHGRDAVLARFLPDGTPDGSFGVAGQVRTPLGDADDEVNGLAVTRAGNIRVSGSSMLNGQRRAALIGYTAHGKLDPDFGENGIWTVDVSESHDRGRNLVLDGAGGGLLAVDAGGMFAVIRVALESLQQTSPEEDKGESESR